jgi:hypothetical protein
MVMCFGDVRLAMTSNSKTRRWVNQSFAAVEFCLKWQDTQRLGLGDFRYSVSNQPEPKMSKNNKVDDSTKARHYSSSWN